MCICVYTSVCICVYTTVCICSGGEGPADTEVPGSGVTLLRTGRHQHQAHLTGDDVPLAQIVSHYTPPA